MVRMERLGWGADSVAKKKERKNSRDGENLRMRENMLNIDLNDS